MPRNVAADIENNFVNGVVTEATGLNFPENAATESYNCIFDPVGNVRRRLGMDFESGYEVDAITRGDYALRDYLWENAGGNGVNNFVVLQVGPTIYFYKVGLDVSLSAGRVATSINLLSFASPGGGDITTESCEFASGKGYLFVTHPYCEPFYVVYDTDLETFSASAITVEIRDLVGLEDNLELDERPSTLSDEHKYNLYNQGWKPQSTGGLTRPWAAGATYVTPQSGEVYGDPLETWDLNRTDFPSNSDVWWLFKDAAGTMQPSLGNVNLRGNSPAPKGHYILNAFYQDRTTASGITGFDISPASNVRPTAVAFFAGRVWYGGTSSQEFNNRIYFSQIVKDEDNFGKCYQENDPTSEHSFDLLPTDGGEIQILDCAKILKMVPMRTSLLIFATNGIWAISGSQGIGFTATDFSINKISSVPSVSLSSFVNVSGVPVWWNYDGIYTIKAGDIEGFSVISLSEKKIKDTFIDSIPTESKRFARGAFDELNKIVYWCYRSTEASMTKDIYDFDTILCFNAVTQAFYFWDFSHLLNSGVYLNGVVTVRGQGTYETTGNITDSSGDIVTDNSYDNITGTALAQRELASVPKFLTTYISGGNYYVTFSETLDNDYVDFATYDGTGVNFESYFISGYKVRGEGQKKFQTNYIYLFNGNDTSNQYHFQSIWDYATNDNTGDFGRKQYVLISSEERKYLFTRLRLRGTGLALQYKVSSMDGYPFNIIGWSSFVTGNTNIG